MLLAFVYAEHRPLKRQRKYTLAEEEKSFAPGNLIVCVLCVHSIFTPLPNAPDDRAALEYAALRARLLPSTHNLTMPR